jgi:hypothetical protein
LLIVTFFVGSLTDTLACWARTNEEEKIKAIGKRSLRMIFGVVVELLN